ncbi:hypothetical protein BACCOPRO_01354, partial [Phocaeicola coprophilus DSM 18228 = JCM 13818]
CKLQQGTLLPHPDQLFDYWKLIFFFCQTIHSEIYRNMANKMRKYMMNRNGKTGLSPP